MDVRPAKKRKMNINMDIAVDQKILVQPFDVDQSYTYITTDWDPRFHHDANITRTYKLLTYSLTNITYQFRSQHDHVTEMILNELKKNPEKKFCIINDIVIPDVKRNTKHGYCFPASENINNAKTVYINVAHMIHHWVDKLMINSTTPLIVRDCISGRTISREAGEMWQLLKKQPESLLLASPHLTYKLNFQTVLGVHIPSTLTSCISSRFYVPETYIQILQLSNYDNKTKFHELLGIHVRLFQCRNIFESVPPIRMPNHLYTLLKNVSVVSTTFIHRQLFQTTNSKKVQKLLNLFPHISLLRHHDNNTILPYQYVAALIILLSFRSIKNKGRLIRQLEVKNQVLLAKYRQFLKYRDRHYENITRHEFKQELLLLYETSTNSFDMFNQYLDPSLNEVRNMFNHYLEEERRIFCKYSKKNTIMNTFVYGTFGSLALRPTTINIDELGVFATTDIPANTIITEYDGQDMTKDDWGIMKEFIDPSEVRHFMSYPTSKNTVIKGNDDPQVGWGVGSLFNHTDDKKQINCKAVELQRIVMYPIGRPQKLTPYRTWIKTTRKIVAGEELFIHYGNQLSSHFDYLNAKRSPPVRTRLEGLYQQLGVTYTSDQKTTMVGYPASSDNKQRIYQFVNDSNLPFQLIDLHRSVSDMIGLLFTSVKVSQRRQENIAKVLKKRATTVSPSTLQSKILMLDTYDHFQVKYECSDLWYQESLKNNPTFAQIVSIVQTYRTMMNCTHHSIQWYIIEVKPGAKQRMMTQINTNQCSLTCVIPLTQTLDLSGILWSNMSLNVFGTILSVRGNSVLLDSTNTHHKSRIYLIATMQ